jgi:hypothetical protein
MLNMNGRSVFTASPRSSGVSRLNRELMASATCLISLSFIIGHHRFRLNSV